MVFNGEGDAQLGMEPGYSEFQEVNTWLNVLKVLKNSSQTIKLQILEWKVPGVIVSVSY